MAEPISLATLTAILTEIELTAEAEDWSYGDLVAYTTGRDAREVAAELLDRLDGAGYMITTKGS